LNGILPVWMPDDIFPFRQSLRLDRPAAAEIALWFKRARISMLRSWRAALRNPAGFTKLLNIGSFAVFLFEEPLERLRIIQVAAL